MKIGVVTFFDNGNYGSELQSMAMNDYLKDKGHQPHFCKVSHTNNFLQVIDSKFTLYRKKIYCLIDKEKKAYLNDRLNNFSAQRTISSALRSHIHSFVSSFILKDTLSPFSFLSKNKYDAFICGSDQVWSALRLPIQPMNFLYGINREKKIAYAPSMGLDVLPHYYIRQVKKYICDFKYLSVREDAARKAISDNYGIEAKQVLDPTLLVGKEYWDDFLACHSKKRLAENYIFCYFLGYISHDVVTSINRIANGRKIIMLPYEEDCKSVLNGQYVLADPLDFVSLIKHADFVLTDSFHGCVFSILYDKQFVVTKRSHIGRVAQTSRILSLLRMFGLEKQYCAGDDEIWNACNDAIDYEHIHPLLQEQQKESRLFLDSALTEIENTITKHE